MRIVGHFWRRTGIQKINNLHCSIISDEFCQNTASIVGIQREEVFTHIFPIPKWAAFDGEWLKAVHKDVADFDSLYQQKKEFHIVNSGFEIKLLEI